MHTQSLTVSNQWAGSYYSPCALWAWTYPQTCTLMNCWSKGDHRHGGNSKTIKSTKRDVWIYACVHVCMTGSEKASTWAIDIFKIGIYQQTIKNTLSLIIICNQSLNPALPVSNTLCQGNVVCRGKCTHTHTHTGCQYLVMHVVVDCSTVTLQNSYIQKNRY